MRIATWNVNSIRQRLDNALAWLKESAPDIVCLQEIKCVDEAFPREAFEGLGYNVAVHGQTTFTGAALLSKTRSKPTSGILFPLRRPSKLDRCQNGARRQGSASQRQKAARP